MTSDEIRINLIKTGRNQRYLEKVFKKSPAMISNAISTDRYPTLKEKIVNHILLLLNKQKESVKAT